MGVFVIGSIAFLHSCEDIDEKGFYEGPELVSFTDGTSASYFVQETNDPGFDIQVGFTTTSNVARTVNFSISGDATEGQQFNLASASITVPAGSTLGTLTVNGIYTGFTGQVDTLILALTGTNVAHFDSIYTLIMQRYCPFNVDDFIGDWTAYEQSDYEADPYDPYTVTFSANPNGGDTLVTSDIWPYYPIKVTFDASNPANFFWNIPDQFLVDNLFGYGEARIQDLAPGSFSSCDQTMNIRYRVYVSAGNFERSTLELVKN